MDARKNFAKVTVSTGYDNSATSIDLVAGQGTKLPDPAVSGAFNLVWWNSTDYPDPSDDPNVEIVRCTARSTDNLTITRAQEGITASTKNTALKTYKMSLGLTTKVLDDINTALLAAGTVTSVCVVSANGFAGSVASPTSTPAITLSTTVSGILKGSSNALAAAVAGTDYVAPGAITGSGLTMSTAKILGRATASSGAVEEISVVGSGSVVLATSPTITTPTIAKLANLTSNGFVKTSGGDGTLSVDTNTYLTGNQNITLTGDISGSGTTSIATTLATVNSNVGTFGSATKSVTITANGKGLITAISEQTVTPAVGSITGFGTGVATALGINVGSAGAFVTFNGALGTPSSATLTNATGLPVSSGISGLGTNVAAWLATPSSANLAAAITDETGSGALVFGTSPGFTTAANPISDDGASLGTTSLEWSDLFLASGGVINWVNGDATLTHSTAKLAFGGNLAPFYIGAASLPANGTVNFLNLTASFANTGTPTQTLVAANFQITTGGNQSFQQNGLGVSLLAGYTGSSSTIAMTFANSVAGTGADYFTELGNFGVGGITNGNTATGHNVGGWFNARNALNNVGVFGRAIVATNAALNIGVFGAAVSGTNFVGGYFGLHAARPTIATSAALMCDNGSQAVDILTARDNGTIVLSIADGGTLTFADAINMATGTSTGTKIATTTSQKIGFWNTAPIVQPTTGIAASTFVANTSGIVNDTATWDSYTIGQVVKALRNMGLLA